MLGVMLILCNGQWPIMPSVFQKALVQGFVCGFEREVGAACVGNLMKDKKTREEPLRSSRWIYNLW
jgi:hypothetical protein